VIFVGHSMGGAMGLYIAENHPDHLKKLAIVDSPPFAPVIMGMGPEATVDGVRPMAEQMKGASIAAGDLAYAQMLEPQLARMTSSPERRKLLLQWSLDSLRDAVAQGFYDTMMLDQRPGLARITAPVTVIFPDNVAVGMAPGMAEAIYADQYAAVARLALAPIANAQHFVMWDQPAAFAAALDAFLADAPASAPSAAPSRPAP
jgi:pimeloyl-ACP methyl ester carboxylesterase